MVKINEVGTAARARLVPRGAGAEGYRLRAPIREAIAKLEGEQLLELEADAGESLRHVKLVSRRAAKEVGKDIQYGDTEQGTLLVWLAQPTTRRTRRRKVEPDPGNMGAQAT